MAALSDTPLLGGPLAASLERQRGLLNALFAAGRRQHRRLDPTALAEHLRAAVDPIARAVEAAAPDRLDPVVEELFRLSVELVGRQLLGPQARAPGIGRVWTELLPALAPQLAQAPERVVVCLSNAAAALEAEPGFDLGAWMRTLREGAPLCPAAEELLTLGLVLPWRLGLAHHRASALGRLAALPPAALRWVLGRPPQSPEPLEALLAPLQDPWGWPGAQGPARLGLVARVGGFVGLGGPFGSPPRVIGLGGQLFTFDEDQVWSLHADRCGATLRRWGPALPDAPEDPGLGGGLDPDGTARLGAHARRFPELKGASAWACDGRTLAVSLPHSHRVVVLAVVPEAG